jgi:hypothetical protein
MEIGMRAALGIILVMITFAIFILSVFGLRERHGGVIQTIEEKEKEGFQKINDFLVSKLNADAKVTCTKSGGIYRYDMELHDLNVFFLDNKRPDREITIMPVLKFKEKKAIDLEKTSMILKSGSDKTFAAGVGLFYTVISTEPPPIFHESFFFHDYLLLGQRIVMKNYEITMTDIMNIDGRCTATLDIICNNGLTLTDTTVRLRECIDNEECRASVVACDRGVSLYLVKFENACGEAIMEIDAASTLEFGPPPFYNFNESFIIGFCTPVEVAEDCTFDTGSEKFYGTMFIDIDPKNYLRADCIKNLATSPAPPGGLQP